MRRVGGLADAEFTREDAVMGFIVCSRCCILLHYMDQCLPIGLLVVTVIYLDKCLETGPVAVSET